MHIMLKLDFGNQIEWNTKLGGANYCIPVVASSLKTTFN